MKKEIYRMAAAAAAVCLLAQTGILYPAPETKAAVTSYRNAVAANQGSAKGDAVIRGGGASVSHDSTLDSDVLDLKGGSFGAGWLQLPEMFASGCTKGFTFSVRFQLSGDSAKYSRLFQFSSAPFGGGNSSYNSPDISLDLNDKTAFRTSVFAGSGTTTKDDEAHRSIFTLDAAPDTEWHQLTATYTPSGATYYLDGKELAIDSSESAGRLPAVCKNLFGENLLKGYTYNSIGHSLYNDPDIHAKIDDVALYDYPLSAAEVKSLPDDAAYFYTFEADTITEGDPVSAEEETSVSADGSAITSIPALQTTSPDGSLVTKIWHDAGGSFFYSVEKNDGIVVKPSRLGMVTTTEDLSSGFNGTPEGTITEQDESYSMKFGKHSEIRNHYYELSFPLVKGNSTLTVFVRVYDDGVAVRYALNHGATIKDEKTQIAFADNSTFWGNWPNATYEWDMVELSTQKIKDAWADYSCPFAGNIAGRYWVLVSEANVFNEPEPYSANFLSTTGGSDILKWKFGVKTESVTMGKAFHTPWRAIVIGDTLNQMANSDLILNLNPPSVLDDISWVKPGKVAWSWWSSGGDSPVEYHVQKDYIDFAAENGWDYVCVDFGWALWDDSAAKIKELCEYGAERGIGIYLWYGVNNKGHSGYKDSQGHPAYPYYSLLDEATITREFERISGLGVKGVKVDYYESDTQETMKQMYMCMDIAAKNHLMVLFHGCTIPKGESRTYPNVVSYEAINGCEYYKWFTSPSLQNRVSYTFTRCVIGSADFTPPGIPVYNSKATAGFALADAVTIESGVQHFAHSVYTYEGSKALALLNDVPVTWDDLRVLDGRPMQFNVSARRKGSDWYIGASTISKRSIEIKLSDLITDDGTYTAYIFRDNADGSDLEIETVENLTKASSIKENLLDNGGCVIKITKNGMQLDTPYSSYKFYEAEQAKLSGKASVTSGKDGKFSSGGAYVGYVGGDANNYVTFENVEAPADGEYTLRIYYISGEQRSLKVDANGKFVQKIDGCYANRGDWTGIRAVSIQVDLKAGKNTVKLYNDQGYGPSIDRIALAIPTDTTLYGDLNGDKRIDARDLSLLKAGLANGFADARTEKAADFNQDGKANALDAAALVKFLTGQE